ncbi:hypothetical protein ACQ4PT_040987 [Festuca glaucescens]
MDEIMKVLDHSVREIKREVNLRVLKVPEIQQKALAVVEYLLANGTERAVEELIENSSQIATLTKFEFVEPSGKDVGLNVRKKAETVLAIVDDREKLQQVREKAAATRDKYLGVSSTGMSYKSIAASFGSGSYSSGSRTAGTANVSSNHMDLLGPNLMDDLVDTPASTSTAMRNVGSAAAPEIDLFADADFQSANVPSEPATASGSHAQDKIDLFVGRSSFGGSATSDTELSVRDTPSKSSQGKPPATENSSNTAFNPFAAIALRNFGASDSFGPFSSSTGSSVTKPTHDSPGTKKSSDYSPLEKLHFGAFTSHKELHASATESMNKSLANLKQASMSASKPAVKKESFQVKSGIWADSLSRGLIDLNIAAPKKVDLSDAGVVGRLSDGSEEKGQPVPWYMEAATGHRIRRWQARFPHHRQEQLVEPAFSSSSSISETSGDPCSGYIIPYLTLSGHVF